MTVVSFPFRAGLEQGVDPKDAPPGTLSTAMNVEQDRDGRIVKRAGFTSLGVSDFAGNAALGGVSQYLLASEVGGLYVTQPTERVTWQYADTAGTWVSGLRVPFCKLTWQQHMSVAGGAFGVHLAYHAGKDMLVSAWVTSEGSTLGIGGLVVRVDDYSSGVTLFGPSEVPAGFTGNSNLKVIVAGDVAYFFWNSAYNNLSAAALSLSTLEWNVTSTAGSTIFGFGNSGDFDVCFDGTDFWIASFLAGGAPDIIVSQVDTTFTDVNTANLNGSAAGGAYRHIAIAREAGGNVLLVTTEATTPSTNLYVIDSSTLAISASVQVAAAVARTVDVVDIDGTDCLVAWTRHATAATYSSFPAYFNTKAFVQSSAAAISNTDRLTWMSHQTSRLWKDANGLCYAVLASLEYKTTPARNVVIECDYTADSTLSGKPHEAIGTLGTEHLYCPPAYGNTAATNNFVGPTRPASLAAKRVAFAAGSYIPGPSAGSLGAVSYDVAEIEFDVPPPWTTYQGRLFVGGSIPCVPTVGRPPGCGFIQTPDLVSASAGGVGTGSMTAGTYVYQVGLKWVSPEGVVHRSPLSTTASASPATATDSVTLTVRTTDIGCRFVYNGGSLTGWHPSELEIYRTTNAGGSTLRKLSLPPYVYALPARTAQTYTVLDVNADSSIGGTSEPLNQLPLPYTASGELEPVQPPSFVTVVEHRGRVIGLAGDQRTLWASKDTSPDPTLAPEFNEALTLRFSTKRTAMASLDGKLIVFGDDDIEAVVGDGPDDTGGSYAWSVSAVHSDTGCTEPRSVVKFPGGILFKGRRTIELLARDLSVKEIGRSVLSTLESYPNITSAVLVPKKSQVRWTCNNSIDTLGVILVFDYLHGAWYVWQIHDGITLGAALLDACMAGSTYTVSTLAGRVVQESTSSHLDGATWVTADVVMSWFGGKNKWARVARAQLLGTSATNHQLTIEHAVNYSSTYEQTKTWAEGTDVTTVGDLEKAQITLKTQRAHSHRIRIYDAVPSDTGAFPVTTGKGPILEGLALTVTELPQLPYPSAGRKG